MERKNRMKAAAVLMAAAMMVSAGTTVSAAGYSTEIGTETGVATTISIDKYLVMDQSATVPNTSFTYTVEAGEEKTYTKTNTAGDGTTTTTTTKVLKGIKAESVKVSAGTGTETADVTADSSTTEANDYKLTFDSNDTTASDNYGGSDTTFSDTTQKYAKKTLVLDFSACTFTEPGIYRYKLTESNTESAQGITYDTNNVRLIDVYVVDATTEDASGVETKKLNIAGYAVYTDGDTIYDGSTSSGGSTTVKSGSFTNTYDTADLTFRKEVSGNQASKDKYFKFTVTIDNAVQNTVYQVDTTKADGTPIKNSATAYSTMTNAVSELKATEASETYDGKYCVTQEFYLQHGQQITIKGLAKGTVYTVTEEEEDYTPTAAGVSNYQNPTSGRIGMTGTTGTVTAALTTAASPVNDVQTSYLNTRTSTIPTGIILTIAPFAAAVLIGGAGLVTILVKRKKAREN